MFRNYLLIAWRNIRKHKGYTAINVAGLSLSMSICLLIILLVYDHFSYDDFHPEGDRIYRVLTYQKGATGPFASGYATSPLPIGNAMAEQYPYVEQVVNMNSGLRGEFRSAHKIIELSAETQGRSLFADEDFFDVFGFQLKQGNPDIALQNPYSIVLNESLEKLLFPDGHAMGSIIEVENLGSYTVTGIVKNPPGKSHIQFNALASMSTLPLLKNEGKFNQEYDSWNTTWMNYNYLLLKDEDSQTLATRQLNALAAEFIDVPDDESGFEFQLQAMDDVVPGRILSNEISFALPQLILMFFGFLGLIVIITASINYANLSVALSLTRTKEVGIRKSNGATSKQIITQFLVESLLISTIALLLAILIYWLLIDQFNSIWIFSMMGISLEDSFLPYFIFFGFSLLIGLISGLGPSLFISRLDTIKSLKGALFSSHAPSRGIGRFFSGKKILLGVQFSLSIIMLVTIFLLKDQATYLSQTDYGFDQDQIYFVGLQGHEPGIIASTFSSVPGVKNVAFTSHHPATGRSYGTGFKKDKDQEPITIYHFSVDPNYIDVMGLEIVAGENFPQTSTGDELFVILNELAVERMGFMNAQEAVGATLFNEDNEQQQILGVVKDYHWEPLMKSIEPLMLKIQPEAYEYAYLKTAGHLTVFSDRMKDKWSELDNARAFNGGFLEEEIRQFYQFMYDLGGILTYISLIAIAITSLGFLGMVSFHLKTRVKEIGIRKVLGAEFFQLAITLSKGFLIMLGITAFIAIPAAIFINGLWINAMAVHSPIGLLNVGPAILIVAILALVIIFYQVWKSTKNNPVESLRNE